jgi:AbrB family looped-hinge helix DNA binding protein
MKVTVKGQVTIPLHIRKLLGVGPDSEVDFIEHNGRVELIKKQKASRRERLNSLRGRLRGSIHTDDIMKMTRGD